MAKSNEPFVWSLFGAGGMVAALFMPIMLLITAVLAPVGLVEGSALYRLFQSFLVRLFLFFVITLPLFHWAHRFRFTLVDLGMKPWKGPVAVVCYGAATDGTVIAALLLLRIGT